MFRLCQSMSEEMTAPVIPKAKLNHRQTFMRSSRTAEATTAVKMGMLRVSKAALEASERSIPQAKTTEAGINPITVAIRNGKKFLARKTARGCGCPGRARVSITINGMRQIVAMANVSMERRTGPILITAAFVAGY